jgi:hypothetical protein
VVRPVPELLKIQFGPSIGKGYPATVNFPFNGEFLEIEPDRLPSILNISEAAKEYFAKTRNPIPKKVTAKNFFIITTSEFIPR